MAYVVERQQQTIAKSACVEGFGLFHGRDVRMELCPAAVDHGIVFERIDLPHPVRIPALIENVTAQNRCTMITRDGASVAVIEHVMAALAGLRIDNCLIRLNAAEPPACDGSAAAFVQAIQAAGIVQQPAPRLTYRIEETIIHLESERTGIAVQASREMDYQIGFILDHGPGPIPFQSLNLVINPQTFIGELAECRTFVREAEVDQLRSQGLALRAGPQNALVFGEQGIIDNVLRRPDECVRHKILDCVGDFALLGCDIIGRFTASRSGHRLNHEIIRQISNAAIASREPNCQTSPPAASPGRASSTLPLSPPSPHQPRSASRAGLGTSY